MSQDTQTKYITTVVIESDRELNPTNVVIIQPDTSAYILASCDYNAIKEMITHKAKKNSLRNRLKNLLKETK